MGLRLGARNCLQVGRKVQKRVLDCYRVVGPLGIFGILRNKLEPDSPEIIGPSPGSARGISGYDASGGVSVF
jgi:hypothetical protein